MINCSLFSPRLDSHHQLWFYSIGSIFQTQSQAFISDIFNPSRVRYTVYEEMIEDIMAVAEERASAILSQFDEHNLQVSILSIQGRDYPAVITGSLPILCPAM